MHVERTTIGGMTIFGATVWAGWPMLAAVAYTAIPSVFLGRMKLKLAPDLHDKILPADAEMMKADMERLDWVEHADVRVREVGHVFFGEVFVVPARVDDDLPARIREAVNQARSINWRLHDVTVTMIDERGEGHGQRRAS